MIRFVAVSRRLRRAGPYLIPSGLRSRHIQPARSCPARRHACDHRVSSRNTPHVPRDASRVEQAPEDGDPHLRCLLRGIPRAVPTVCRWWSRHRMVSLAGRATDPVATDDPVHSGRAASRLAAKWPQELSAATLRPPRPRTATKRGEQHLAKPSSCRDSAFYSRIVKGLEPATFHRGDRLRLALLCGFPPFCGLSAVPRPSQRQAAGKRSQAYAIVIICCPCIFGRNGDAADVRLFRLMPEYCRFPADPVLEFCR